jgi:DNA/RNA endonuclease G (NUC1)
MNRLVLALLLVSSSVLAGINQTCPQFTAAGAPQYTAGAGDQEICHANYAVIHRCDVKAPLAVFEHLTQAAMSGPSKRKDNFRPDPLVTPACSEIGRASCRERV